MKFDFHFKNISFIFLGFFIITGCSTRNYDGSQRLTNTLEFRDKLISNKNHILATKQDLTLIDCLTIAEDNNLKIRLAEVNANLSSLNRKIIFSNLLPKIDLRFNYQDQDHLPLMNVGGGNYSSFSDRSLTNISANIQIPIFVPQAWYIYEMSKKGELISKLVKRRTKEIIHLQITSLFYSCLAQQELERTLDKALEHAKLLLADTKALQANGLVMPSDLLSVEVLLLRRKNNLQQNKRSQKLAMATLLKNMGLDPLANISLSKPLSYSFQDTPPIDKLIFTALLNRIELLIADKQVEISDDQVKATISVFLPKLGLVGSFSDSSNSFLKYAQTWSYGVMGVMTLFDGFKNIEEYHKAKELKVAAYLRREQQCMSIMLEVFEANQQLEKVVDDYELAKKNQQLATSRIGELIPKVSAKIVPFAKLVEASIHQENAQATVLTTKYQRIIAEAILNNVVNAKRINDE